MKIEILDRNITDKKTWFLGKISLWDYLSSVRPKNFEFDIQRGIVKNKYLDSILQSIKINEAIPPVTITINDYNTEDSFININDGDFNILDGLQRTYRLLLYKMIAKFALSQKNIFDETYISTTYIIQELKKWQCYVPGVISVSQIKQLLDASSPINVRIIESLYKKFSIYLYIWSGLNEQEIIQKMLILNAGQRQVSIRHQYELMFLQIIKDRDLPKSIKLVREKETNFSSIKAGRRSIGEFVFSSTIIGIQSLIAGKPIRLSSDNLELGLEDDYISEKQVSQYFNHSFLDIYLNSLYDLDNELYNKNPSYLKWFVKDTTISGIMGAIGFTLKEQPDDNYNECYSQTINSLIQEIKANDIFDIQTFYNEYNKLASQKINIGNKVRMAIYTYTKNILQQAPIKWNEAFNNAQN